MNKEVRASKIRCQVPRAAETENLFSHCPLNCFQQHLEEKVRFTCIRYRTLFLWLINRQLYSVTCRASRRFPARRMAATSLEPNEVYWPACRIFLPNLVEQCIIFSRACMVCPIRDWCWSPEQARRTYQPQMAHEMYWFIHPAPALEGGSHHHFQ